LLYKWVAEVDNDVRERALAPTPHVESVGRRIPLNLKLQFDVVSSTLEAPYLLFAGQRESGRLGVANFWDRMLVCWTRARSLGSFLMSSADAAGPAERDVTPNP
jgi:hypothetical protein